MVHIANIRCEGLLSFKKSTDIAFTGNTVIVGPNNSGKSNVFRLLKILVDSVHSDDILDKSYISPDCFNPSLAVSVKLSVEETQRILDLLSFSNVKLPNEGSSDTLHHHNFANKKILLELFNEMTIDISWNSHTDSHASTSHLGISFPKIGLLFYGTDPSHCYVSNKFSNSDVPNSQQTQALPAVFDTITSQDAAPQIIDDFFNRDQRSFIICLYYKKYCCCFY